MENNNEFDSNLKLIAKSSVIVFAGIFLSKIFTYLYRIIIAREFGPEAYGLFSLALVISGWFIVFASLGLNQGLLRYIPLFRGKKDTPNIQHIFKTSFFISLVSGILLGVILFLSSSFISISIFHEPSLVIFLKIFSLIVPLSVLINLLLAVLISHEKVAWHSFLANILPEFLNVVFILLLLFIGLGIPSIPLSNLFGALIVFLLTLFILKIKVHSLFAKKEPINTQEKTESKIFKELFSYSWPLLFAGIMWKIFHWTDSLLIGYFLNAKEVGIYNAAVPISFLLFMSAQLFMHLFFPLVNKRYSTGDKETVNQLSKQVGKWIFAIDVPLLVLLIFFPDIFIKILFGLEYIRAANSLRLLSIGMLFMSVFEVSNKLIAMVGKSKVILFNLIIVCLINFILDILLIRHYGIDGAAFATMLSSILISLLFAFQSYKDLKILPLRKKMLNIALAALMAFLPLIYLKKLILINITSTIILSIFFSGLYVLLVFFFNGLDRNDFMILRSFLKKIHK